MNADETASYIRHHLTLAGRSDPLFSDDAITLIHTNSRGKPRSVNNLTIAALIAARAQDKTFVDEASARSAITETTHHLAASP
jgi:type II secretory pathway predicted ATPase ExeA